MINEIGVVRPIDGANAITELVTPNGRSFNNFTDYRSPEGGRLHDFCRK
jgi:hypothetical protein